MSSLEGKIVEFHVFDEKDTIEGTDKSENNFQDTCPALVLTDWNKPTDNVVNKSLNLRVFPDGQDPYQVNSVMHVECSGHYPDLQNEGGNPVQAKKGCWSLY
jgi:hypothetical protein